MRKPVYKTIIGVLILFALFFIIGAATHGPSSIGRFQVVVSPSDSQYAYVIDTSTGEVWGKTGGGEKARAFYSQKIITTNPNTEKKYDKPLIGGSSSQAAIKKDMAPVRSEQEAVSIAVREWSSLFGHKLIEEQEPYVVNFMGGVWVIHGSAPRPNDPTASKGAAWIVISEEDGKILGMTHTQ